MIPSQSTHQTDAFLAAIIESSDDAIVSKSLDGIILSWNNAAERIFGYTAQEAIGRSISLLLPPDRSGEEAVILRRLRGGERIDHYETVRRRKDGTLIDISLTVSPIRDDRGVVVGASKIVRDITDRKRTESALKRMNDQLETLVAERTRELRQTNLALKQEIEERRYAEEELIAINTELERFAYVTTHDLREPLRMVSSYIKLLARRYQGSLGPDADDFIAFAVEGAERMDRLIRDLLAYARAGARTLNLKPVDCSEVVARALGNLETAINEARASVTVGPLPRLVADATQLGQVFQNLIGNALKFRGQASPEVRVSSECRDHVWLFAVKDNGIGFEPCYAERIFEVFQRLHPRNEYPGTGIGLAICQKIITAHGGQIWGESELGKGARFYFTIPIDQNIGKPTNRPAKDAVRQAS